MDSNKTSAKGLRLKNELWEKLSKLAKNDKRRLNEYIAIVLSDHVKIKLGNYISIHPDLVKVRSSLK